MKYLLSTVFFSVLLISCQKKDWSLYEKETLMNDYIKLGFEEKEAICTLDYITNTFSYSYFSEQKIKFFQGTSDEKFADALIQVNEKCSIKGYTKSLETKVTSFWINYSGISSDVAQCLFGKIKEKYTYEQYIKFDTAATAGKADTVYLAFLATAQNECKK